MNRTSCVAGFALSCLCLATPALAQNCSLKQIGAINLTRAGAQGQGAFLVPVAINSTPTTMALDAGSSITALRPNAVRDLKLPVREIRQAPAVVRQALNFAAMLGPGGARSEEYTHIDTLTIGTAGNFVNSDFLILPAPAGGAGGRNADVAGVLGLGVLSHFDLELDLSNATLNLFDTEHCDGQVTYWNPASYAAIPFRFDFKGRIRLKVTIDGADLDAVLGTTAQQDTLNLDIAEDELKFDKTAAGVQRLPDRAGGAEAYRARFKSLALEGISIDNPELLVLQDVQKQRMNQGPRVGSNIRANAEDNREPDVTLGLNMLTKLHIYIAFKEKKLYASAANP